MSPDSGISSLPSPVSVPDNCPVTTDAMVLRSQRLVGTAVTSGRYNNAEFDTDLSSELCWKFNS